MRWKPPAIPTESPQWRSPASGTWCAYHVLVPDGTFRPLAWVDFQHVERLFRAEVLRMLLGKELITEAVVDNVLSWRHSGSSAHSRARPLVSSRRHPARC